MMTFNNEFPIIKLNNGLTVMNFSSPHEYIFTSGEVLPACSDEVAQKYKLNSNHTLHNRGIYSDVLIKYDISDDMYRALQGATIYDDIDIILVPYPVLDAWSLRIKLRAFSNDMEKYDHDAAERVLLKIRTCKLDDRVTKKIRSDQFCTSVEGIMVINESLVPA